jgi:RimJ/RimL family protein N-acetyltransferase
MNGDKIQPHSLLEPLMIKHQRIALRHVTEPDLPILTKVSGDPVARGEFNPSRITSPQAIQKRFQDNGFSSDEHELLLICNEFEAVIGDVVHFKAKRYATAREIGWTIHDPANRNRGYATEAVTALIDYLFKSFPINRIECGTATQNHASIRLAEKCGLVREGVMRGLVFVGGVYLDEVVLSILRSDWEQRQAQTETSPLPAQLTTSVLS